MQHVGSAAVAADMYVLSSHDCLHVGVILLLFRLAVRCSVSFSSRLSCQRQLRQSLEVSLTPNPLSTVVIWLQAGLG